MADFLDEKRKEIQARLKELRPLVDEYHRLEAAEQALSGVPGKPATAAAVSAAPARRRRSSSSSNGRRGRPRGSGTRAAQALQLVTDRPGITIPELADAMGIKQNYLYRVMPGLAEEGKVTKSGRGWHVAATVGFSTGDAAPSLTRGRGLVRRRARRQAPPRSCRCAAVRNRGRRVPGRSPTSRPRNGTGTRR